MKRYLAAVICMAQLSLPIAGAASAPFVDPLDQPSAILQQPGQGELMDVVDTGQRLVGVGPGGYILVSEDHGVSWKQVRSPVSADLTAVSFPTAQQGWAVGHDGVVLHTADGGLSWSRQLDGRGIAAQLQPYYRVQAEQGNAQAKDFLPEAMRLAEEPPAFPLFAVWFRNEQEGFVIGAFNLILHTRDGGKSWQPWMDRTDNPQRSHLYGIAGSSAGVFIVGELGLLLRLDPETQRFSALQSPYPGSYFGVAAHDQQVLAFGLRGNAFESRDGGQHWLKLNTGSDVTFAAGAVMNDGALLLINQDGRLLRAAPGAVDVVEDDAAHRLPTTAMSLTSNQQQIILVGPLGARTQLLKKS